MYFMYRLYLSSRPCVHIYVSVRGGFPASAALAQPFFSFVNFSEAGFCGWFSRPISHFRGADLCSWLPISGFCAADFGSERVLSGKCKIGQQQKRHHGKKKYISRTTPRAFSPVARDSLDCICVSSDMSCKAFCWILQISWYEKSWCLYLTPLFCRSAFHPDCVRGFL